MLHYKIPRTYQYSLGIQRQLPKSFLLDVSFAGNYNIYTDYGQSYGNQQNAAGIALQQAAMNDPTFFSRQVPNPMFGIVPSNFSLGSSATVAASTLFNNYPLWNGYTQTRCGRRSFPLRRASGSAGKARIWGCQQHRGSHDDRLFLHLE